MPDQAGRTTLSEMMKMPDREAAIEILFLLAYPALMNQTAFATSQIATHRLKVTPRR